MAITFVSPNLKCKAMLTVDDQKRGQKFTENSLVVHHPLHLIIDALPRGWSKAIHASQFRTVPSATCVLFRTGVQVGHQGCKSCTLYVGDIAGTPCAYTT